MSWRTFRNALQKVHLWVGLIFMVPIILIGISGSIIVLLQSIPDLGLPAATARGEPQSIASVIAAAEAAAQGAGMVAAVAVPQRSGQPMQVQFGPPPGTRRANPNLNTGKTVFVDPVSLKILGDTERRGAGAFWRTLTTLHVAMMAPGYFGLQFVGWMGVAMVLFGISGLVLWWPKESEWRLAFGVKKGARGFRLNRDLHGAAGFWSLTVFLILSVSGVDLAFPVTFQNMVGAVLPLDSGVADGTLDEATIASIANRNALTVDDAAKLALAAVPNARLLSIQLLPGGGGIYMVAMNPEPYGNGAPQISAFVGPGAEVSSIVDPRTYSLGKRILVWLRVLHYGYGFGPIWTVLVFLSGFLPLLFGITGFRMWQLKQSRHASLPAASRAPSAAA
jgi:uncharacterized iron-regulated membrane protein